MRRLGCLVVVLAILGGGLVVGDLALTSYAEERTAARVEQALEAEAEVDLDGWPVALRLLLGSIPTARVTAADVPLKRGATLDRLEVELTDVEVNVADLRSNPGELPPAASGTFTAQLSEESVAGMLRVPEDVVRVRLRDGVVVLRAAGVRLRAEVVAADGDVVVRLAGPLARLVGGAQLSIDLSDEPGAPAVDEVEIRHGVMVVRGTLEDVGR